MWKMMMEPARAWLTTVRTMPGTVVCALGSPDTTSQVTDGEGRAPRHLDQAGLHSPKGGRKATARLP